MSRCCSLVAKFIDCISLWSSLVIRSAIIVRIVLNAGLHVSVGKWIIAKKAVIWSARRC